MQMISKKIRYTLLTTVLILYFIYVLLPYSLIREVIIGHVESFLNSQNIDLKVDAKSISPYWLTGLQVKDFTVSSPDKSVSPFHINEMHIKLSLLPILLGEFNISGYLEVGEGNGAIDISIPIWGLLSGNGSISAINGNFEDLNLNGLFAQFFYVLKKSSNPDFALLVPVVANSSMGGSLNGSIDYKNDSHYSSKIHLFLNKAFLELNNKSLDIPRQDFSKANFHIVYENGLMSIKKDTMLVAQNISINTEGFIKKNKDRAKNIRDVNMTIQMKLSGQMENNFGFLVPQLMKCPPSSMVSGNMKVQLIGTSDNLTCN